ncbi:MAG: hypothetical protein FWF82_03285 [Oscillospiraceae bacterium]|nr:hypothetical protein [Oscillospiraceae bacterium]
MKNNKNPLYIMIAVMTTVAMVAGMFSLTACRRDEDGVKNPLEDDILSYEDAERSFVGGGIDGYSTLSAIMKKASESQSGKLIMTLTPEQYITDLIAKEMDIELKPLKPATLEMGVVTDGINTFVDYLYKSGDKEVLSCDMWQGENGITVALPALFDKFITIPSDESDMMSGMMSNMLMSSMGMYGMGGMFGSSVSVTNSEMPEMPSDAALKSLTDAVVAEYFELIRSRTKEEVELTLNGKTLMTNKTEIEFTEETMVKLALAILEAVDKNDDIKRFISEYYDAMFGDYEWMDKIDIDEVIKETIENGQEALEDADGEEVISTMNVYVCGSLIVRREVVGDSEGYDYDSYGRVDTENIFAYSTYDTGEEYFTEFLVEEKAKSNKKYQGNYLCISDSGTISGGKRTGKISFEQKDYWTDNSFKMSYADVVIDKDCNLTSGDISIELNEKINDEKAEINLSFKDDSFVGSFTLGGAKVATAELTWKDGYTGKSAPELNAGNSVSVEDLDEMSDEEKEELIQALSDMFGFDFASLEDMDDFSVLNDVELDLFSAMIFIPIMMNYTRSQSINDVWADVCDECGQPYYLCECWDDYWDYDEVCQWCDDPECDGYCWLGQLTVDN